MRLYVDCEFNGFGGELISLAIVAEDGREFYEVLPYPYKWEDWVKSNVKPILGKEPLRSKGEFLDLMRRFLSNFDNPTIVADWYTDLIHFFTCFQGKDHSESFAFPCKAELILLDKYDSKVPHNALEDARAIKEALSR